MIENDKPVSEDRLLGDEPNEVLRASIDDVKGAELAKLDWAKLDQKLFARIESEQRRKRPVVWLAVAGALAAAVALWSHEKPAREETVAASAPAPGQQVVASALVERRGGEVTIDDVPASLARELHTGDHVAASGAGAVFEREGKVRWLLEGDSSVKIEHAEGPLVLSLDRGAAEAQVVPVPNGEAFAIDVTSQKGNVVRVAVHGTHLRVARTGDHVTVDLTEGVISVGAPPKRGSTLGELVTAPAHVELDIDSMALDVRHDVASVRAADPLAQKTASAAPELANKPEQSPTKASARTLNAPAPMVKPAPTDTIAARGDANDVVSGLVRSEVRANAGRAPSGVTVIPPKHVALKLELTDDGYVRTVMFDPPLPPDVQRRITDSLFDPKRTRFVVPEDHQVRVDVPIDDAR